MRPGSPGRSARLFCFFCACLPLGAQSADGIQRLNQGRGIRLSGPDRVAASASLAAAGLLAAQQAALECLLDAPATGYLPPGIAQAELKKDAACAKLVNRAWLSVFGGTAEESGLIGHAWRIGLEVKARGGLVLPYAQGTELGFQPGDILGMHYKDSIYNKLPKPVDYSHVALVLAVLEGGDPVILHAWRMPKQGPSVHAGAFRQPLRVERLSSFLARTSGRFEPRELIRPRRPAR